MPENQNGFDTVLPIQFTQGLVRAAALNGISVDDVLVTEGIELDKLDGLPVSKIAKIVNFLIEQSPFTTIFPLMRVINDEAITEMLAITSTSKNLLEANKNLLLCGPFSAVGVDAYYQIGEASDLYEVTSTNPDGLSRLFLIEICMAAFVRFLPSQFNGADIFKSVDLEFDLKGNRIEYEAYFGCPVNFNQPHNRITLNKNVIEQDILSHSPNLLASAMDTLREKVDVLLSLQGYRFKTSQVVKDLVAEGIELVEEGATPSSPRDFSIDLVSSRLGLNVRALQRKLKLEDSSYVDCKNQTLIDESKKWMDKGQSNLDVLAETLGYSDRAAFSKVFKKYEGIWPAQYKDK